MDFLEKLNNLIDSVFQGDESAVERLELLFVEVILAALSKSKDNATSSHNPSSINS